MKKHKFSREYKLEAVKQVRVGGKVLVAEPVLEVAYHAAIATKDFQQVNHLLPGTPDDRLRVK
jgi:hypothetical protein